MMGEEGQGRKGDVNSPTTQSSKESRADGSNNNMARGLRNSAAPHPRDTATDDNSAGPLPRKSNGTNGARPENGMHLHRNYGLFASEEPEGGRSKVGHWVRGDDHGATRGTAEEGRM